MTFAIHFECEEVVVRLLHAFKIASD
jgi:hypothetical protein